MGAASEAVELCLPRFGRPGCRKRPEKRRFGAFGRLVLLHQVPVFGTSKQGGSPKPE